MSKAISRALLGKIVDEVFGGAIEDASVIEEIYSVIKREEAALSAAEPFAAMTTDYLGCEDLSRDVSNIEEIAASGSQGPTEVIYLYDTPQQPAPSVAVKALEWDCYYPEPIKKGEKRTCGGRRFVARQDIEAGSHTNAPQYSGLWEEVE